MSPFANTPPRRIDAVIQAVRETTTRRDAQTWEGIPSGSAGFGASDTPKDLRVAPTSTGADSESWDRDDPAGFTGALIYWTRTAWDESVHDLVEFVREVLIDSRGMIVSIGPETRVVIDDTGAC